MSGVKRPDLDVHRKITAVTVLRDGKPIAEAIVRLSDATGLQINVKGVAEVESGDNVVFARAASKISSAQVATPSTSNNRFICEVIINRTGASAVFLVRDTENLGRVAVIKVKEKYGLEIFAILSAQQFERFSDLIQEARTYRTLGAVSVAGTINGLSGTVVVVGGDGGIGFSVENDGLMKTFAVLPDRDNDINAALAQMKSGLR